MARVIVGSPAQRAGLREGDAVISIDGQPTGSVEHLNEFVERGEIGSKHRLEIVRDQARTRVEITIEEMSRRSAVRKIKFHQFVSPEMNSCIAAILGSL